MDKYKDFIKIGTLELDDKIERWWGGHLTRSNENQELDGCRDEYN